MSKRLESLTAVLITTLTVGLAAPAFAQRSGPQGESYASIAKLPDWSGIWVRPWAEFEEESAQRRDPANPTYSPKLSAEGIKARDTLLMTRSTAGSVAAPVAGTCGAGQPAGVPGVMRFSFGIEFLFTPGRVTMLLEQGSTIRRIHTDGRPHSSDPEPAYVGESIGHWEGDTLVVDTSAIEAGVPLSAGIPSSGKMRIVERVRRVAPTRLEIETMIEDPVMLREPLRYRATYERSTFGWFDRECDSDRDGRDQEPDLTPPK
jgi:hypothetical protein